MGVMAVYFGSKVWTFENKLRKKFGVQAPVQVPLLLAKPEGELSVINCGVKDHGKKTVSSSSHPANWICRYGNQDGIAANCERPDKRCYGKLRKASTLKKKAESCRS